MIQVNQKYPNIEEKGGIIKRLFGRKKHVSGMGGDAYDSPGGHGFHSSKKKTNWINAKSHLEPPESKPCNHTPTSPYSFHLQTQAIFLRQAHS